MKLKHIYTDFPLYFFMIIIFIGSTITSQTLITNFGMYDKIYHVFLFFLLGYGFYRFMAFRDFEMNTIVITVILGTSLYGLIDETHQLFVTNRSFDLYDLLADFIGGFIAAIIGRFPFSLDNRIYTTLYKISA